MSAGFVVALHHAEGRLLLAVCDAELAGARFEEGGAQLDLGSPFFSGREVSGPELLELFGRVNIINIVGPRAVALAIGAGVVNARSVGRIAGVPHAQALRL